MTRRSQRDAALQAIYDQVPRIECQGLCHHSCGPIGMGSAEAARLRSLGHGHELAPFYGPFHYLKTGPDLVCPHLHQRRCSIYDQRPLICRLWGVTERMPCPFGCIPERVLSHEEAKELIRQSCRVRT